MIVVMKESNTRNFNKSICYNSSFDTLIMPEELLNELNSTLNSTISPLFKQYTDIMELTLTETKMIKLDEYLGSIGLVDTQVINKGGPIYGIC